MGEFGGLDREVAFTDGGLGGLDLEASQVGQASDHHRDRWVEQLELRREPLPSEGAGVLVDGEGDVAGAARALQGKGIAAALDRFVALLE